MALHKYKNLNRHERAECGMRFSGKGAYGYRGLIIRQTDFTNWEVLEDGCVIGEVQRTRRACREYIDERFDLVHKTLLLTENDLVILNKVLKKIISH